MMATRVGAVMVLICTLAASGYAVAGVPIVGGSTVKPSITGARTSSAANCEEIAEWASASCSSSFSTNIANLAATKAACDKVRNDTETDCLDLSGGTTTAHVVSIFEDGSFVPRELFINDGDTVLWSFFQRGESVIPIDLLLVPLDPATGQPIPAVCREYKPYDPEDLNEFTGPMRRAVSGVFAMSPEKQPGADFLPFTIDPVLRSADFTGVALRIKWSDLHLGPGQFDWQVLDRNIEEVVENGKMFSLEIKAGQRCNEDTQVCDGTPAWIFDPAIAQASAVEALSLSGAPTFPKEGKCGIHMVLGSPADPNYRTHYFELLEAAAAHIKENNGWYQALAYIKPAGANLFTAEARLPHRCWSNSVNGLTNDRCNCVEPTVDLPEPTTKPCICNPQVWSVLGNYTPAALYEFYTLQTALLAREFPEKDMSYMLIQAGFPLVNNAGEYEGQDVVDETGYYSTTVQADRAPQFLLPGGTEQTEQILQQGADQHGIRFVVQHNALNTEGHAPNRWALEARDQGQFIGFQTKNTLGNSLRGEATPEELGSTMANALNAEAVFIEVYQVDLLDEDGNAESSFDGRTLGNWDNQFHALRRVDSSIQKLRDPFPFVHGHTFRKTSQSSTATQDFKYIIAPGCNSNTMIGEIHILP